MSSYAFASEFRFFLLVETVLLKRALGSVIQASVLQRFFFLTQGTSSMGSLTGETPNVFMAETLSVIPFGKSSVVHLRMNR